MPDRRIRAPDEIFPGEKRQQQLTPQPKPGNKPTQPGSNFDLFVQ